LTAEQVETAFNLRKAPPGFEGILGQPEVVEEE
jgi:hypothetical protein